MTADKPVTRQNIIDVLLSTRGQSEGVTADAILGLLPAVAVPDKKPLPELMMASYHEAKGWNDCIDEIMSAPSHGQQSVLTDAQINEITLVTLGRWPSFEAQAWACKVVHAVKSHNLQSGYLQIGHLQVKATPLFGFQTSGGPYYKPDYNPITGVATIQTTYESTATGVVYRTKAEAWAIAEALKAVYQHALKVNINHSPSLDNEL